MQELENENNKIKSESRKVRKQPVRNIKKEIKENYEIGIEYYQDVDKRED